MRVTLLVDNEAANEVLRSEHGLSFLVETDCGYVIFDTGQSDAWLHNLIALGYAPEGIRAVAVSHGHYDHTGGLAAAFEELTDVAYFAHPACFEPKYALSASGARYNGVPEHVVTHRDTFTLNTCAVDVLPGVRLSGEIPLRIEVVPNKRFAIRDNGFRQDTFVEEQCLVLRSKNATAVLVGCAHRGVENNVLAAMDVARIEKIDLLAGGFHLGDASESRLYYLSDFLERIGVEQIACCHCTGTFATEYLRQRLGRRVVAAGTGMCWDL